MSDQDHFSTDQLEEIAEGVKDPRAYIQKRFIEALVVADGEEYNSFIVNALKTAKSRGLELLIKLIPAQDTAATGLPTTADAMAAPVLAEPVLAGPTLAGPALAGPTLAGPALAGPALARPIKLQKPLKISRGQG